MAGNGKVRVGEITSSKLGFELVDKSDFTGIKEGRNITWVPSKFFRSSRDMLIGYGFSRCQGVVLIDSDLGMGALLHNHPENDPSNYLIEYDREEGRIIDPKATFPNSQRVKAFHIYHEFNYSYPQSWVQEPLKKLGFNSVEHIPIKDKVPGRNYWMDIVLDVKNVRLYVFPTHDFDKGLRLDIK